MKIYSSEYITDFDKLKHSIIGFEFEFYTDRSYYKLLELFNNELSPIKTHGFRKYHSNFKPDENNFKLEPDLSGGNSMCELITGPLPYVNSKIILLKILRVLDKYAKTDEKCSIHINISFEDTDDGKVLDNLNQLKLILETDEDHIYNYFPERKNNIYAKSVKTLIPFKEFNFSTNALDIVQTNIQLPDTKYYGINFKPAENIETTGQRLEWRYIGGLNYHKKTADILSLMDYFISLTWNCLDEKLDEEDQEKLQDSKYPMTRRQAKTIIHVNQHVIRRNATKNETEPVLTVKNRGGNLYGHEAVITDDLGNEIARVVYRPDKPLSCGARVWIETLYNVDVVLNYGGEDDEEDAGLEVGDEGWQGALPQGT